MMIRAISRRKRPTQAELSLTFSLRAWMEEKVSVLARGSGDAGGRGGKRAGLVSVLMEAPWATIFFKQWLTVQTDSEWVYNHSGGN